MTSYQKFSFIRPTLKFAIAGIFIPGFTAILIFLPQMGMQYLGMECALNWKIIWVLSGIGTVVFPYWFIRQHNRRIAMGATTTAADINFFNVIEYTFIQCAFSSFVTTSHTLCYVTDGQNGLELVFTGWIAIPFVIAISYFFDYLRDTREGVVN
jgi:hypothetical protein